MRCVSQKIIKFWSADVVASYMKYYESNFEMDYTTETVNSCVL